MLLDDSEPWSVHELFRFLDRGGYIDIRVLIAICTWFSSRDKVWLLRNHEKKEADGKSNDPSLFLFLFASIEATLNKPENKVHTSTNPLSFTEFAQLLSVHAIPATTTITKQHLEIS